MNAEIIAVGTELLLGQIANTNAQFISKECAEIGIHVYYHSVVGDNPERLEQVIRTAETRSDILIFTGGLGPTKDDLTKETLAKTIGSSLVTDQNALDAIEGYFKKVGRPMTENNRRQAIVLEGSTVLPNNHGMAPGMIIEKNKTRYILMPGVPSEMKPMFLESVKPYLTALQGEPIESRVLRFFGIGESALETELMDLIDGQSNPTVAPLAKEGEVTLRLSARTSDASLAQKLLDDMEKQILQRVGTYFYGYGDDNSLAAVTFETLKNHSQTVAMAESLTGGLFAETLTAFSGASEVVKGGIVCYTNEIKEKVLGISSGLLETEGAVSAACAEEMADRVRHMMGASIGISFTGVAGPSESEGKSVGTVFIGLSMEGRSTEVLALNLSGSRSAIRNRTVKYGLTTIRKALLEG